MASHLSARQALFGFIFVASGPRTIVSISASRAVTLLFSWCGFVLPHLQICTFDIYFAEDFIHECLSLTIYRSLTSRRSQPPLALSVPLSRFTSRVGGGSAFYVRPLDTPQIYGFEQRDNQKPATVMGDYSLCRFKRRVLFPNFSDDILWV